MAIKFLRGIYGRDQVKTTRPVGFKFPTGLTVISSLDTANSSTTATLGTVDVFVVAGGGPGGYSFPQYAGELGGGGGAGGVRLSTANSLPVITEFKNTTFTAATNNFIPVIVGGDATNSCFGSNFLVCGGGSGGNARNGSRVSSGGSGGGGGRRPSGVYSGANGIAGQGCNGTPASPGSPGNGGAGGSATCTAAAPATTNANGLTTSFTGTSLRFGDGGNGASTPQNGINGTANRGNGGNAGGPAITSGGSGIVAVRYCNPAAPTTPLATGGNCVCCTGGCIIHIFTSSGFLNVNSSFSIN